MTTTHERPSRLVLLVAAATLAAAGLVVGAPPPVESAAAWTDSHTGFDGFEGVVALDRGRPRVAYRDADNRITYGWCDGSCADTGSWQSVNLGPPALWVDLAIDRSGRPRIAYRAPGIEEAVFYAACESDCGNAGSWAHTQVDATTTDDGLSLALDDWGRPRLTYVHVSGNDGGLHPVFAACDADCTSPTGWSRVELPGSGGYPSIVLDGTNPRIAFDAAGSGPRPGGELRYLACNADCFNKRAWTSTTVTWFEAIGTPSIAVDGDAVHITFNPIGGVTSLAYTSCVSGVHRRVALVGPGHAHPRQEGDRPQARTYRGQAANSLYGVRELRDQGGGEPRLLRLVRLRLRVGGKLVASPPDARLRPGFRLVARPRRGAAPGPQQPRALVPQEPLLLILRRRVWRVRVVARPAVRPPATVMAPAPIGWRVVRGRKQRRGRRWIVRERVVRGRRWRCRPPGLVREGRIIGRRCPGRRVDHRRG